ncbi:MAG: protein translocase subunit SecF [Candidatus Peribacteria bacterium]|jgi:preprotein translocase SecF subunit|nr:protein translocase subunit SecF [Candidatus Peribacteria bacterium]
MNPFNIIKKSYLWVVLALAIAVASLMLFLLNAKFSEEFTGGVNISLRSASTFTTSEERMIETNLKNYLDDQGYNNASVHLNPHETQLQIKINASLANDEKVAELSTDVQNFLTSQKLISSSEDIIGQAIIGPSVGSYMKTSAFQALIIGILLMVIYMLFAFGKIRKDIPASILGITVLGVLVFNVLFTLGAYGMRMMFDSTIQVDTVFIIAVLTVVAYGVNDVIVIFDRIRENILKHTKEKVLLGKIIEASLWQTMRRSIGTSFSTLLVLITMFIFGTGVLRQFALAVGCGIIAATLSSIFLGGSLAYLLMGKFKSEVNKL